MKPRVFRQPALYHRVFVGAVVVENHMQIELRWSLLLKVPEELQELLMSVPGHAVTDYGPLEAIQAARSVVVPFRL